MAAGRHHVGAHWFWSVCRERPARHGGLHVSGVLAVHVPDGPGVDPLAAEGSAARSSFPSTAISRAAAAAGAGVPGAILVQRGLCGCRVVARAVGAGAGPAAMLVASPLHKVNGPTNSHRRPVPPSFYPSIATGLRAAGR